jgi:glycylpeptide N-tetradecanoyltransferase
MSSESKPNAKARAQDIVEQTVEDDEGSASSDSDAPEPAASSSSTPAAGSSSKKKKKKKTKALKALLKGDKEKIPQALVNEVLQRAQQDPSAAGEIIDEDTVRHTMEQLKIMEVLKGKAGLGGKNKKEMGEHKVSAIVPRKAVGLTRS